MDPQTFTATQALDQAKHTRIHKDITTIASLALFLAGLGYFILTLALPLIDHQWHLSQQMAGMLGSAALFGAIIGALGSGYLTDHLGRRVMLIASIIGVFSFSILSALAWNTHSLLIMRFLLGVSISSNYPVAASYLAETMTVKSRGRKFCQAMFINCVGAVAGVIASYLILCVYRNVDAWRYMLALTTIPALWAFKISLRIPESPRWLLSKNRHQEAEAVISKMTQQSVMQCKQKKIKHAHFKDLFKRQYIKQTLLVCITWFLMDISYYGIGIFTPNLMESLHLSISGDFFQQIMFISKQTVFANLFILIGAYLAIVFIEKVGRIKLQSTGFFWVTIGLLVLCSSALLTKLPMLHLSSIFIGFALFNLFINLGPGATTYLIPAEIYPTHLRGKGHGFATACAKIGAALGIFILPILQHTVGAITTVFIIAITTLLGYVMTSYLGYETKGQSLEEINDYLTESADSFIPKPRLDPTVEF